MTFFDFCFQRFFSGKLQFGLRHVSAEAGHVPRPTGSQAQVGSQVIKSTLHSHSYKLRIRLKV